MFDDFDVVAVYDLQDAVDDGVIVEIFKDSWVQLSGGKPIVATDHLFSKVTLAAMQEIWNEYVHWKKHIEHTLPVADRLFASEINSKKVWVIEDAQAITLMYPEDY